MTNGAKPPARQSVGIGNRLERLMANRPRASFAVGLILLFLVLFAAYLRISLSYPKNSDDADFILRAQDILSGNVLLSGWVTAPDSFYTVLLPFYVLGGLLVRNMAVLMAVVPAATYALLVVFCAVVTWARVDRPRRFISVLIVLMLMALPCVFFYGGPPMFFYGGPPVRSQGDHKTTTFFILIAFYLLSSSYSFALACLPLILAAIGDPFALWIGILPAAAVGLVLLSRDDSRRGWQLTIFAVACALLAKLAEAGIRFAGGYESTPGDLRSAFVTLDGLSDNVHLLLEGVLAVFDANPFGREVFSLEAGIPLVHLGVLIFLLCVASRLYRMRTEDTFKLLLLAAMALNVIAFVVSTVPVDRGSARFLPTLTIFGPLVAAISWYEVGLRERVAWAWVLGPFLLLSYLIPFARELVRPVAEPPQGVIQFLEAQGFTEGYGSYWSSGILTVLSRGKVKVRQVSVGPEGKLVPLEWQSARRWYATDQAKFLVIDRMPVFGVDRFTAIRTWGVPKYEEMIDGYLILTWPSPLHLAEGAYRPH